MKTFLKSHLLMLFSLLLIWMKTLIVSSITFRTGLNTVVDMLIFAINPFIHLFILFGIGLFLKPHFQSKYFLVVTLFLTSILYANVVYYREFNDIITLPMLLMGGNIGDLSTSIFALIQWYDVIYFLDSVFIGCLIAKKPNWITVTQISFQRYKIAVFTILIIASFAFVQLKYLDKTQLFNRDQIVRMIGIYNFYIHDIFKDIEVSTKQEFAKEDDLSHIITYLSKNRVKPHKEMFNIAKDMNIIVISLESFESFVIGETVNGQEITPFLNDFIGKSFYFDNFFHQTGQGKTSDAEFLINNSLYPLDRGAVFLTHADNDYRALPETLLNHGYSTAVFHANDETFYNRNIMYPNLGYKRFYSFNDYNVSTHNSVGWGLKDIDFFKQSINYLKENTQPFFCTLLTLTNHFPYHLDEEDYFIEPLNSESNILNQYFQTVRYTDEAMKIFLDQLKEEGLYENSILVIYGDHYGLAPNQYEALSDFLGKEITLYQEIKLGRVPLIIHIPGMEGETLNTISGQIDVMPTLLNLLGIPEKKHVLFGNDLFAENREDFVVLRNGSVITDELIYTNERCLSYETGEEFSMEQCVPIRDQGIKQLNFSDKIIYEDLLRFEAVD